MGRTGRKRKRRLAATPRTPDHADLIDLQKWMRLKKTHMRIRTFPGTGRGIGCTTRIPAGGEIISVPLRLIITRNARSDVLTLVDANTLSSHFVLSVFLMYEHHLGDESVYRHYVKLLPRTFSTLFFCNDNELRLLPRFMKEPVLERKREIDELYENLVGLYKFKSCRHCGLDLNEIFGYSQFTWAWFVVNTRSVYYKDELYDSLALAPFLDMFNHSVDADTQVTVDEERRLYMLKSLKPYRKNEQVFIKYGSHSNWNLLLEYGFILENNPNDYVEFTFDEIIKAAKEFNVEYGNLTRNKYNFIKQNNLNKNLTKSKEEFSWNAKSLLYILATSDENLSVLRAKCYSSDFGLSECEKIRGIMKIAVDSKRKELSNNLNDMKLIDKPTESFALAKELLRIYISILNADFSP